MVRINLLPIRGILRSRELKQFAVMSAVILCLAVGMTVVAYVWLSSSVSQLNAEQGRQKRKLVDLKKKNREINNLKGEIARLQRQVDTIKKLTKIRDTPAPFLQAVSKAIPDEVWIQTISKSGKGFSLDGQGVDNTVVVKFVQNLQKAKDKDNKGFFTYVKLVQTVLKTKQGMGTMDFKIVGAVR